MCEWERAGFTKDEADKWIRAGFELSEAKSWSEYFSPEIAARWREYDFTPENAYSWAETLRVQVVRSGRKEEELEADEFMALKHRRVEDKW